MDIKKEPLYSINRACLLKIKQEIKPSFCFLVERKRHCWLKSPWKILQKIKKNPLKKPIKSKLIFFRCLRNMTFFIWFICKLLWFNKKMWFLHNVQNFLNFPNKKFKNPLKFSEKIKWMFWNYSSSSNGWVNVCYMLSHILYQQEMAILPYHWSVNHLPTKTQQWSNSGPTLAAQHTAQTRSELEEPLLAYC